MNEKFIVNRITQLRMEKDVSEIQMSFDLDRSSSYVNMITRKKNMPSLSSFLEICDYFGITPVQFFLPEMDADAELFLHKYIELNEDEKGILKEVMEGIIARKKLVEIEQRETNK